MEDILGVYLIIERYFCQFFIENTLLALIRISSWAIVLGTDNKTCGEFKKIITSVIIRYILDRI